MIAARLQFDITIAGKICAEEILTALALGYPRDQAYRSAYAAIDDLFEISRMPERATVMGRFRP